MISAASISFFASSTGNCGHILKAIFKSLPALGRSEQLEMSVRAFSKAFIASSRLDASSIWKRLLGFSRWLWAGEQRFFALCGTTSRAFLLLDEVLDDT